MSRPSSRGRNGPGYTDAAISAERIIGGLHPGFEFNCYEQTSPLNRNRVCCVEVKVITKTTVEQHYMGQPNPKKIDTGEEVTWPLIACRPNWMDAIEDAKERLAEATLDAIGDMPR